MKGELFEAAGSMVISIPSMKSYLHQSNTQPITDRSSGGFYLKSFDLVAWAT